MGEAVCLAPMTMPSAPFFPLLTTALAQHAATLRALRAQVAEIEDEDTAEDFEAAFEVTHYPREAPEAIERLQARIGMPAPEPLKALYAAMGGFRFLDGYRMAHIDLLAIADLLSWADRGDVDPAWPSLMGALCTFGSREEFSGLKPASQEVLTREYVVFGWAHHRYEDLTLLVFDAQGAFHNVVYEHDCDGDEWVARYQPVCQKTLAGIGLDGMLAAHVEVATRRVQRQFDEGEYLG